MNTPFSVSSLAALLYLGFASLAGADEFTDMAASLGTITTIMGTPHNPVNDPITGIGINFWQPSYEGGPASAASLSGPHIANADAFGNVYIADKFSHAILKITPDGNIHTFAGTHVAGFNGDGPAPANMLQLNLPNGVFVFPDGTVYLLDPGNRRIRRVGTDGIMTTIVTNPATEPGQTPNNGYDWYASGRALWVSPDRQLIYYTNEFAPAAVGGTAQGATVKKWTPAGGIEVVCSKAVGFVNPGNIAVNPIDGKLYVTDRAEEETPPPLVKTGLWRIDGPNIRTRMTGDATKPVAADGQLAVNSFVEQPRGIAFLPNGAYFLCTHKAATSPPSGDVWYVDTAGVIHLYIHGRGSKDYYNLTNGLHPPLTGVSPNGQEWLSQPRAVTIAPNGDLLVVCNDSGYVFRVNNLVPHLPSNLHGSHFDANGLLLNWGGLFSRGYRVQRTSSLLPANWQTIGAAAGNAGGVPSEFLDPAATGQAADFYRLAPSL